MARLLDVVFDCRHAASLARFWAAALDGYEVAPYDQEELDRLAGVGILDVEDDPTVVVQGPPGAPKLWFQAVPEAATAKAGKNRVHLDVVADDPAAEVERLVALGAVVLAVHDDHHVLGDPEGNELCLYPA